MVSPGIIFRNKGKSRMVQVKSKDESGEPITLDWKVKPLAPRLMVKNYKYFAALEKLNSNDQKEDLTEDQQIETLEKLSPLIDVVLPYCCIAPKVVFEGETNEKQINIDDIDIETLMGLFTAIFESSGLSAKGEDERKNIDKPQLPKVSQPSV